MAYVPKVWIDGSEGGTPILAADLNHVETGLADTAGTAEANAADVAAIDGRVSTLESGLAQTNANFDALYQYVQDLAARVTALESAAAP